MMELIPHMAWADAAVWDAALRTPGVHDDERARDLLYHVHTVQWVYMRLTRGEAPDPPELDTFGGLEQIRDWARAVHEQAIPYYASLNAADLDRPLVLPWADRLAERYGSARPSSVRDGVLQVAVHSTYHRGQVAARIREHGGEPPLTDFIVWVWSGRPAARWTAAAAG